jgi:transcriptional regulator with XRE-family HTH domain
MELKIKELRDRAGFSQEEIAAKMEISQSAYARFELSKTKIDLKRLESFAGQLNMSLMDVITYPERYVNMRDIGKELNIYEPDVVIQIKVRGNKRENVLKAVFEDNELEILNR